MKTAIGYIRVSTEQQANEGVSLDAQRAKIEAWCTHNGYELVQVYVDAGISGKSMDKRPGLQDALKSLKKGMALVSYSLSRLARSTKDAISIGETVAKRKADLTKTKEQAKARARMSAGTRDWVPWVFIPVGLLGVIWLMVFYIAGNQVPLMQDLRNWNYLIGLGLIAASFVIATLWK